VLVQNVADQEEEVIAEVEVLLVHLEKEASHHAEEVLLLDAEALLLEEEAQALRLKETTTTITTTTTKVQVLSIEDKAKAEVAVEVAHLTQRMQALALTTVVQHQVLEQTELLKESFYMDLFLMADSSTGLPLQPFLLVCFGMRLCCGQ